MRLNNYLNSRINLVGALCLLMGLTSCGSYQYVGYEDDGIYGSSERTIEVVEVAPTQETQNTNSEYYQNYFREKALELDNMNTDELIFTDIDEYESSAIENDSLDYQGFGGWGQTSDNVTINIIDNSWGWNAGLGWNAGWGWNNWGWGRPWGWNRWNWNAGWGWYDPWYSPGFIGWNRPYWYDFYCPPYYYNRGFNNNFYSRRNLAYNTSRRGALYSSRNVITSTNRRTVVGRNSNATISRRNTAVSTNRVRSRANTTTQGRRTVGTRDGVRPRTSTTRPRTTTSRPSSTVTRPRTTRSSGATRSNTVRRSSSSSRSSNSSYNRSSSTINRSGSSSRSSSRSSGSRSSSRRGNNL
jgi:hypothetical protein